MKRRLKNKGLLKVIKITKGQEITQPSEIGIFTFAPVTSVELEKFFSGLKSFIEDRPNMLEETAKKRCLLSLMLLCKRSN